MRFTEKLRQKSVDNEGVRTPIIAFLGDSVTQGCFEIYQEDGDIKAVFEGRSAYSEKLKEILGLLYPEAPVAVVNFGVEGDSAVQGVVRMKRDVVSCHPDLLVVCFGLNDSNSEQDGIADYKKALKQIFKEAKDAEMEVIFMTPNMLNTEKSRMIEGEFFTRLSQIFAERQNNGTFDAYMDAAREACREEQVALCDCYAVWKRLHECGVNTTNLLSNGLNHPVREMHYLFAWMLADTICKI